MKTYLLSAAGVIFLSVIVSLLMPEGKLNKSVTFAMRIICILVLIQPLTALVKRGDSANDAAVESMVDYEYVCTVYQNHQSVQLENLLKTEFGIDTDCTVFVEYADGEFSVVGAEIRLDRNNAKLIDKIYAYLDGLGYINITVYAEST